MRMCVYVSSVRRPPGPCRVPSDPLSFAIGIARGIVPIDHRSSFLHVWVTELGARRTGDDPACTCTVVVCTAFSSGLLYGPLRLDLYGSTVISDVISTVR